MSWLYTIVFAGLMFSSSSEVEVSKIGTNVKQAPAVNAAFDETEKFEQSYPLSANGRVSVSNVNGSIVVEAWDKNEVRLEATKIADSKETLGDVEIKVDARPDSFSVETEYKDWKWSNKDEKNRSRKIEVQFKLMVPRTAILNEIETVNGSVSVSNFVNYTKVSAVNGNVNAGNLRGTANLSTVNGEVIADFDRLEQGSKINCDTVNGSVNLTIPSDADATIKADSLNGNITNEFGLPVRKGEYVGRDLYGKVGSGDVQIRLNSVNGPLAVNRKKDGKNVNPSTNLLPAKRGNDKWDDDDSENVRLNTAKMNRDIARSMRDAEHVTAQATREAGRVTAEAMRESARAMKDVNINLDGLKDLNINIDGKAIEKQIADGMKASGLAMARMRDARWMESSPAVERKTNTFTVKGTPKVTVDAKNCSVRVRGWDKPEVKYVVTSVDRQGRSLVDVEETHSDTDVYLKVKRNVPATNVKVFPNAIIPPVKVVPKGVENVNIDIDEEEAVVEHKDGKTEKFDLGIPAEKAEFEKKYGKIMSPPSPPAPPHAPEFDFDFDFNFDDQDIRIDVFVPRKSNIKIITEGEIRLEGVSGEIDLVGDNGAIDVRGSDGKLNVSNTDGTVRIIGFRGDLIAKTSDGEVYMDGDFNKITGEASDGRFVLTVPENIDADIVTPGDRFAIEDLPNNKQLSDNNWRFGKGGRKYSFSSMDGSLLVQNRDLVEDGK